MHNGESPIGGRGAPCSVNFTGELTQLCMTGGIKCFAIQPSAELASSLASDLGFNMRGSGVRGAGMEGGGAGTEEEAD